jgi:putative glutamine amidotransferase
MKHKRPIVGIPACMKMLGDHPFHVAGAKYIDAVVNGAGCIPLILPAIGDKQEIESILELVDGILLTGSVSNIAPVRYGETLANPDLPLDTARDATTFPLIDAVLTAGKPLFGICRGFQEINVAFGGTLHQEVHSKKQLMDHRAKGETLDEQYGEAHLVKLIEGGFLRQLIHRKEILVNSIHGQGIAQLGDGLSIEAMATDGLIEAISVKDAKNFALAVQWHPEWKVTENPQYMAIFKAFGNACRL